MSESFTAADMATAAAQGFRDGVAYVQNMNKNEHVAGDVSKNGAESNMAQQPVPSTASKALRPEMLDDLIEMFATAGLGRHNLMRVELPRHQWAQLAVALSRLHTENERPAALVEAQQPATCGNTPYDEGPFTLAQQPSPSAAAADPCPGCIPGGYCRTPKCGRLAALNAAPKPSPTPQADSQPAPVDAHAAWSAFERICSNHGPGDEAAEVTVRDYLMRAAKVGCYRAARAPADSVPAWANQAAIEYRYTGGTHWCPLGPAERMKPNFDGVYRLQGGVFPVEAPADSVTAPAGVIGPDGMMRDELRSMIEGMSVSVDVSTGDHDAGHRYFGTVTEVMDCRDDKHGVTLLVQDAEPNFAATPPAQAADSVLEDVARESEYRRGYRHGYEQRDAEVRGALA